MPGEQSFSLFGTPTPQDVRRQIGRASLQDDISMSQLPAGSMGKVLMGQSGRLFGNAIGSAMGMEDPQVARAKRMQEAQQRVTQMAKQVGINFGSNPKEYIELAAQTFADMGEQELAFKAIQARDQLMQGQSEIYKNQAAGDAALVDSQYKSYDILSKIDTRSKQLVIDEMKARAYAQASQAQAGGSAAKMQQWGMYKKLLDKIESNQPLTPGEQTVFEQLGKAFSMDQTIARMFGGTMVPSGTPEGDPLVPPSTTNPGVIDLDDYPDQ